jgi:hypothetical protein
VRSCCLTLPCCDCRIPSTTPGSSPEIFGCPTLIRY